MNALPRSVARLSPVGAGRHRRWLLLFLFLFPLILLAARWSALPTSKPINRVLSVALAPDEVENRVRYILFVPLGACVVVFFRLTLGIRVLGPFRSILIAVAFQVTGLVLGLLFVTIVVAVIVAVRPMLKALRLPYFGRVSMILSAVAAIMVVTILGGTWLGGESMRQVAYFPIVVLCLIGEAFAKTLAKEGHASALWRGGMTVLIAVLITALSESAAVQAALLRHPEILFVQMGCIVAMCEFLNLRLLQRFNPVVVKKARAREARARHRQEAGDGAGRALELVG